MISRVDDGSTPAHGCLWVMLLLFLFWALMIWLLAGCACPQTSYGVVPAWAIPAQPRVETVPADALQCLNAETYLQLARRDRACWNYAGELRALLGPEE